MLEDLMLGELKSIRIVPGPKKGTTRMDNHDLVRIACDKVIKEHITPHATARSYFHNEK
jgi:hypothetical protein